MKNAPFMLCLIAVVLALSACATKGKLKETTTQTTTVIDQQPVVAPDSGLQTR